MEFFSPNVMPGSAAVRPSYCTTFSFRYAQVAGQQLPYEDPSHRLLTYSAFPLVSYFVRLVKEHPSSTCTSSCHFNNHIIRVLNGGSIHVLDFDIEGTLIVECFHLQASSLLSTDMEFCSRHLGR